MEIIEKMYLHITLQSILKISHHPWLDTAGVALGTSFVAYYMYYFFSVFFFETYGPGAGAGSVFTQLIAFEKYRRKWFSFLLPTRRKSKKMLSLFASESVALMIKYKRFTGIFSEKYYEERTTFFKQLEKEGSSLSPFFREELQKNLDLLMRRSEFISIKCHLKNDNKKLPKRSVKRDEFADKEYLDSLRNQALSLKFICGLLPRSCPKELIELRDVAQDTYDKWYSEITFVFLNDRFLIVH